MNAIDLFTEKDRLELRNLRELVMIELRNTYVFDNDGPEGGFLTDSTSVSSISDAQYIVVAGGYFASKLQGEKPKDLDIFILCGGPYPDRYLLLSNAVKENAAKMLVELVDNTASYRDKDSNIWAVYTDTGPQTNVQYIFSKHSDRIGLISKFDFVHTMISVDVGKGRIYSTYKSFDAARNRKLIANHMPQEWRRKKFLNRGYIEPRKIETEDDDIPWFVKHAQPGQGAPWVKSKPITTSSTSNAPSYEELSKGELFMVDDIVQEVADSSYSREKLQSAFDKALKKIYDDNPF